MTCPNCGAQWSLPNGSYYLSKVCPFCHGNMCSPNIGLISIEDALKEVFLRFGVDVLNDGEELISLLSEIAPMLENQMGILQFFIDCGGHKKLLELKNKSLDEQQLGFNDLLNYMTDKVNRVCNDFFLIAGVQPQFVSEKEIIEEFEYIDLGEQTVELTSCKGTLQREIRFPNKIDGKQVVSISGDIFGKSKLKDSDRNIVESIYISDGVEKIGDGAFYGCKSLNTVRLPDTLRSIGDYSFRSCKSLYNIALPDSVTNIGKGAFAGSNIKTIYLPNGIEKVFEETFKNCKSLEKVIIPNSVRIIDNYAFSGCKSITNIFFPKNIEVIGNHAFQGCKGLVKVSLPDGIETLGCCAFAECDRLSEINLPDSITSIEAGAFKLCAALNTVKLPSGIKSVSLELFDCCRGLKEVYIPEGITSIEDGAFYSCRSMHITIPKSVHYIAKGAFSYCDRLTVTCYENSLAHGLAMSKKWKIELL